MKNRTLQRFAALVGSAALAAVSVPVLGVASASAATDITIGVNPITTNAMAQYALDKGFFAKNGLNAKIQSFPTAPLNLTNLANGTTQFAYVPTASVLTARTNGSLDLKIVAPADGISRLDAQRAKKDSTFAQLIDPQGICVDPKSGITSPKQLAGKEFGLPSRGGQSELVTQASIRRDGGDPKSLTYSVISVAQAVALVKQGRFAGAYVAAPFTGQCIAEGMRLIGSPSLAVQPNGGPASSWITTSAYAAANPSVIKAFQRAMYEAALSTYGKPAAKREVQLAGAKIANSSPEMALRDYPRHQFTTLTKADIQEIANALQQAGLVVKPVDVPGILLPQYRP